MHPAPIFPLTLVSSDYTVLCEQRMNLSFLWFEEAQAVPPTPAIWPLCVAEKAVLCLSPSTEGGEGWTPAAWFPRLVRTPRLRRGEPRPAEEARVSQESLDPHWAGGLGGTTLLG